MFSFSNYIKKIYANLQVNFANPIILIDDVPRNDTWPTKSNEIVNPKKKLGQIIVKLFWYTPLNSWSRNLNPEGHLHHTNVALVLLRNFWEY